MLINFEVIMARYGKPNGIIHIGAHHMQERAVYQKFGLFNTIWIEANPKIVKYLNETTVLDKKESLYHYAITDSPSPFIDLHVTSFDQSSSIFKLGTHKKHYPQIEETECVTVPAKRMDALIAENNIDIQKYDFINLDIQGAELLALKSFGNYLNNIKYIYTEVNTELLYEGCCLLTELDSFLQQNKFVRTELQMTPANWGDAFYIKKNE
jgi:FkbM family methyltransferase